MLDPLEAWEEEPNEDDPPGWELELPPTPPTELDEADGTAPEAAFDLLLPAVEEDEDGSDDTDDGDAAWSETLPPLDDGPEDADHPNDEPSSLTLDLPVFDAGDADEQLTADDFASDLDLSDFDERPRFTLEWQDAEAARCLLPWAEGFVAIGRECRFHSQSGELLARHPAPSGFEGALVFERSDDTPAELLCVAHGLPVVYREGEWSALLDAGHGLGPLLLASFGGEPVLGTHDGRWFGLERDGVRWALQERALPPACRGGQWFTLGSVLIARDDDGSLAVSVDAGARVERVPGSRAWQGLCLGQDGGRRKVWTTTEDGELLRVIEYDVSARRAVLVATLPWPTSAEDRPTVHALLWLPDDRRLIVASDAGVVSLTARDPEDATRVPPPAARSVS